MSDPDSSTHSVRYQERMRQWLSPLDREEVSEKHMSNRTDLGFFALGWVVFLVRVPQIFVDILLVMMRFF